MSDLRVAVIGDAHIEPGQNLARFEALGNYLLETRPDEVVLMGDFVSMNSLSSYDKKGGVLLEGTRAKLDVEVGKEALKLLWRPIVAYNRRRVKFKERQWRPNIHYIEGNHEERIVRWWKDDAQMAGLLALPEEFGPFISTYTHYGDYLWLSNVGFTHVPFNKIGPISSAGMTTSIAQKAASQSSKSIVFGHTHLLDLGCVTRIGNHRPVYALNAGCFFEPENDPAYMEHRLMAWWRGIIEMTIAPTGEFDFKTINLETFKARYQ